MSLRTAACGGRLRCLWRSIRLAFVRANGVFVYHPSYAVDFPETMYDRRRSERILAFLAGTGVLGRRDLFVPRPVSIRKLRRVHGDSYLDALQSTPALVPVVGFEVDDRFLEHFLQAHRYATGGTVLATDLAVRSDGLAVNLGGGFHHAEPDRGQGFCVFNDIGVAIANWRNHGGAGSVLVIDLDLHDGDGTRAMFRDDPDVFTFSIHNRDLGSPEAVASESVALGDDVDDRTYLETIRERLPRVLDDVRPALVYYLAGCDPAHDDRLGNWRITADGMLERDRFVLDLVRERPDPPPTVFVLAGGYGSGAWRYSARALSWYLTGGTALEPPRDESRIVERFRRQFRRFHPDDLSHEPDDDPLNLTADDIMPGLGGARTRFLGFYTRHGIEVALERYGLLDRIRALGLRRLRVDLDLDPVAGDTVRLFSSDHPDVPILELRARKDSGRIPGMELLLIEWLRLQNPAVSFSESRPRLPGQEHPGLGFLREVFALLVLMCERLDLDGLVIVAGHYHLVSLSDDTLRFLDPADRTRFQAIRTAVSGRPLPEASRRIDDGELRDARTGAVVNWDPIAMALPVTERFRARLDRADAGGPERPADPQRPRYRLASDPSGTGPVA